MLSRMKRSVLSAALDFFIGRNDIDDTMRRLRQQMKRQREGRFSRPTADVFAAALGGRQSVEVFFRRITKRR
jgi:hypothetical protein